MSEPALDLAVEHRALQDRVKTTLARLSQTGGLPTLPSVATAALGIARDPEADIDALCRIIQADVGLSARVLRLANSAAVGRRTPARKLPEAVVTIGMRRTCDLLVAVCAKQLYETPSSRAEGLWNHALANAVAAEQLARVTRRVDPGRVFLPALFHDVGRIAFLLADGSSLEVIESLELSNEGQKIELEREWYGFDHQEAGAILAEDWGLSMEQCDSIRWHHSPDQAGAARDLAALLNAADAVAYQLGMGTGPRCPEGISLGALGLSSEEEESCAEKIRETFEQYKEMLG